MPIELLPYVPPAPHAHKRLGRAGLGVASGSAADAVGELNELGVYAPCARGAPADEAEPAHGMNLLIR